MEPKDLTLKDLKGMHVATQEKYRCANNKRVKAEASIVLSMIDEELENRGYDVSKLFKNYNKNARY